MKQSEIVQELSMYVNALQQMPVKKSVAEINLEILNWMLDEGIFIGKVDDAVE